MDIRTAVAGLSADQAKTALERILTAAASPAFGTLPKREFELLVFTTMTDLGILDPKATIYDLMTALKVGRSKASQLVFDREIRGRTTADLDATVREALATARFVKDGELFAVEQESPLVHAHFKAKLQKLGHAADASFNPSMIRITLDAVTDLAVDLMPEDDREKVRKALIKAGAPDDSVRGTVKHALKALVGKAKDTGADMATDYGKDQLKILIAAQAPAIILAFQSLLH